MSEPILREIVPGVVELRLPIPWENGSVNCFLFPAGNAVDMLDCGMASEESLGLIRAAVATVAGPEARVRRLVVTHIHADHFGGAGDLVEGGAELLLHHLEVPLVHPRYLEIDQLVEEVGRYLLLHGVPAAEAEFLKNASRSIRDFVRPALPALGLDGSESIIMGEHRLRVEWTPGHSPGHVVLFHPEQRLLFAGDQLLPDASPNIGLHPQSTSYPLDDYLGGLALIRRFGPRLVLPAHGSPFEAAEARIDVLEEHHRRRKAQITEIVTGGALSGWEVATAVWGLRTDLHEMRMALQEGLAHLQSLAREGILEKCATARAITWRRSG